MKKGSCIMSYDSLRSLPDKIEIYDPYSMGELAFIEPEGLLVRAMYERFKGYMKTEKQIRDEKKRSKRKKVEITAKDIKEMSEDEIKHFFDVPNYNEDYWWEDGFSYSFDYFENIFWELIELSILGTPEASDFAKHELCELMWIDTDLIGKVNTENLENDEYDSEDQSQNESLVDDIINKKDIEEMNENEKLNLFNDLIERAIDKLKEKYGKFTAAELFDKRIGKDPSVFSRIRSNTRGTSKEMLLYIGVGLELSYTDMQILFTTKGWVFPSDPRENIVGKGIKRGLSWKELMVLIPQEPSKKNTNKNSTRSRE